MKNIEYDQEELEILDFIENGNPQSIPNLDEVKEQLRISANVKISQEKEIYAGVMAGIEDADSGRVRECNEELAEELKAKLRSKLELKAKIEKLDYDDEELEILDFIENGNYVSATNAKEEIEEIKASVRDKIEQEKQF